MKNILVAVDINKKKDSVLLNHTLELAEKFKSNVVVLHIAPPNPDFVGYQVGPRYIRNMRAKELREEHKILNAYAEKLKMKGIPAESLLVEGPTVEMLLAEVEKLGADVLVMGAHKHSFLYRTFKDDTAVEMIKKTKIPLLIVPIR